MGYLLADYNIFRDLHFVLSIEQHLNNKKIRKPKSGKSWQYCGPRPHVCTRTHTGAQSAVGDARRFTRHDAGRDSAAGVGGASRAVSNLPDTIEINWQIKVFNSGK